MSEWRHGEPTLALSGGDVHVWRVDLGGESGTPTARRAALLSPDERARADRFRLERDRRRFVLARSAARLVLAAYLDAPPEALRFDYGPRGKPSLAPPFSPLAFNVSHSDDLALIAVRERGPLGVDIERVRPDIGGDEIAERFFCPAERAWLRALAPAHRPEGFFCLWTRKESYIKGLGEGVWHELTSFDVSQSPPDPVRQGAGAQTSHPWFVHDLAPGDGFRAALAVEGSGGRVLTWQMSAT